jgi:hypothetical protein
MRAFARLERSAAYSESPAARNASASEHSWDGGLRFLPAVVRERITSERNAGRSLAARCLAQIDRSTNGSVPSREQASPQVAIEPGAWVSHPPCASGDGC